MANHQARGKYTTEFKLEAVRQVKSGQAISIVSRVLNVPKASLGNWVRQDRGGELGTAGDKPGVAGVTAEQMELSRLRAENARLRVERDIAKKAAAYFAQDVLRSTPGYSK
jgi:transposase